MDDNTKDSYLVAGGFVLVGLLFLYSGWGNFDLVFYIGIGLSGLGIAGFKWTGVAEILLHWARKQEKANENINSKQTQRNTKNSNQIFSKSGDIHIHHHK